MRSVLTRQVFRQIIHNEPLAHPRCLRLPRAGVPQLLVRVPRRSIFGFGRSKSKQKPKAQSIEPGLAKMIELGERLRLRVRPHSRKELQDAFASFINSKALHPSARLTDVQVEHCLATVQYLRSMEEGGRTGLDTTSLEKCLRMLYPSMSLRSKEEASIQKRVELATLLYHDTLTTKEPTEDNTASAQNEKALKRYLRVLAAVGRGSEALKALNDYIQAGGVDTGETTFWNEVIRGLVNEDEQHGVTKVLPLMEQRGIVLDSVLQRVIINTLAFKDRQDIMKAVRYWYQQSLANNEQPTRDTDLLVARLCMKHGETELGQSIITRLVENSDLDLVGWNTVLSWAVSTGKGVQELERLIEVMKRRSGSQGKSLTPDASTINAVFQAALWQNNAFLAERIIALGRSLGVKPDVDTWILQVNHRLDQGDIQGAVEGYDQVRARAFDMEDDVDTPTINRLITALCNQAKPDMDKILVYISDILERKLQLEPTTVCALSLLHMRRDEIHNAIDLLQTYAQNYDREAREMIRDKLVELCVESGTNIALSWDSYIIIHRLFGETPRATREDIMLSFFRRKRPDMAVHVFGHMRQSPLTDRRPSGLTYRKCFEGIAQTGGDEEILDIVHNMLKLDSEVDPDTRLNNSLMMAQAAASRPEVALKLWDEITESDEGPTYESIRIAFMACEEAQEGETEARKIWNRLNDLGVEVNKDLYTSYLWALAGKGQLEEAKSMIESLQERFGSGAEASTLGVLYNIVPGLETRAATAQWCAEKYPEVWRQVEAGGKVLVGDLIQIENYDVDRGLRS